jgi:hypothetical protein
MQATVKNRVGQKFRETLFFAYLGSLEPNPNSSPFVQSHQLLVIGLPANLDILL